MEDSPHPRGWTRLQRRPRAHQAGFPAPAGMDLSSARWSCGRCGIPRTRGDGPAVGAGAWSAWSDSPHPRGWTLRRGRSDGGGRGFPAPAGMDLSHPTRAPIMARIPRTRGDGPGTGDVRRRRAADSPHPRGWTLDGSAEIVRAVGFPAPAGMDRRPPRATPGPSGIPRTRGDGPRASSSPSTASRDSPHPRGWTRGHRPPRHVGRGFPAPAGMDLKPLGGKMLNGGIPRTRGDGPRARGRLAGGRRDSPHPRGWTPHPRRLQPARRGFPAPAGMDPGPSARCSSASWIPRTRGDGPRPISSLMRTNADSPHPRGWTRIRESGPGQPEGFPAPAGMDLTSGSASSRWEWIPRTRGDGPLLLDGQLVVCQDSPHPRGWTSALRGPARGPGGFPAPAGMDPIPAPATTSSRWIPRTRGDGPRSGCRVALRSMDSLHPRGWAG